MRLMVGLALVSVVVLPSTALAADEEGPRRVLRLYPQQGLQHTQQAPAWEQAAPKVVDNVTKDAKDLKSGNADHHPGSFGATQ